MEEIPSATPTPTSEASMGTSVSASPAAGSTSPSRPRPRLFGAVVAISILSSLVSSIATVGALGAVDSSGLTAQSTPAPTATSGVSTAALPGAASSATSEPIVAVAAKARPAVVTISSSGTAVSLFGIPTTGVGSGFIFDARGLILTNWHVVEGASELTVTLADGRELDGRVVASDPDHDLAVVRVDATGLPTVDIGRSADLQVGQLVVAIGSPLGTFTDSVTSGILSAMGRSITVADVVARQRRTISDLLQTDAAINEGNSGGPLLDEQARVIGINTAQASNASGIGFAIPIDEAADIIAEARADL